MSTEQTATPQAWSRWQQQTTGHGYAMMDNSTFVPYESRAATSAPMNVAIMAPQYMVAPQYNMTPMPAMGHCTSQNHFAYAQYDSPPTSMNMLFRLPAHQERPVMPVAAPEHDIPRASSYSQESPLAQSDRNSTISTHGETKMSNPKTPHPLNTKDIKFNKPTSAEPVNFTTAIDTLMKAIQKRRDSEDIVKGVPEIEQLVKPKPRSPKVSLNDKFWQLQLLISEKPEAGPVTSVPTPAPAATESTDTPKPKRYVCTIDGCGKSFYQSTHLDTHKRAHTGEKPYTHVRRHTGEKPFRCEQCSKVFAQRGNLQTHMATHTNAKPFVCKLDDCNKMFTQRGNLKNHQNKYHEKTLMEMTDWIVSISDIDALSDDQREMYWYFANLYKNSNKGIKGRGKDRRVSNRVPKSRTAPSSYHVKGMPGPSSLAAYSSKRLPQLEQYIQQQRQQQQQYHQQSYEVYDTDMDQSSSASSPRYDGIPVAYRDRMYQQSTHAMY
ncbi:Asparagine-rich zinc finger protein AZF1 [Colletotrichum higginsianum]|uniref:Asparagine-rich zinc finger protein AZF1 n=1 Tax=Colletotrichum higginsianum TaxID=80884 RepID=A0A4T0VYV8_9PEZI|nr:Asparagine-rich zinc finger protein AZF1 [Colletotrichum higginsianum]